MGKTAKVFECQSCGFQNAKWLGKCPSCGTWDSFVETKPPSKNARGGGVAGAGAERAKAICIEDVVYDEVQRISSGEDEFDRVLGGGAVEGSLVLIGGSPGVGKSTLLIKISANFAKSGFAVLYVSAEESLGQIKLRADRVGANAKDLYLLSEINLENIQAEFAEHKYDFLVIDSIQTIYKEQVESAPGSVSQVREITFDLMRLAKTTQTTVFIIGHITKEGSIAGPRVLEHMVDTVLYFEGDASANIRILRTFKNRFGSTSEIGIFEMSKGGLVSASSLSGKFFNRLRKTSGSAIGIVLEGTRALILEVQALVSDTSLPSPKRSATGFDSNRLNMLLALLEKKLDLPFNRLDVFINIAGGIKISETGADLAVIAAILSSFKNRPISEQTVFLGEVSLTGDIRELPNIDARLSEAANQGFTKAIVAKKPVNESTIKCFVIDEVAKLLELM